MFILMSGSCNGVGELSLRHYASRWHRFCRVHRKGVSVQIHSKNL